MIVRRLDLDGLIVDAAAPEAADHEWLEESYRVPASAAPAAVRVALVVDEARLGAARAAAATAPLAPGLTFEGRDGRLPRWREGDAELAFDGDLGVVYAVRGDDVEVVAAVPGAARVGWLRALRELHERALRARGASLVHAAAVALPDGRVVLLAGPRQSGKSTLLVYLLGGGARYVTNDRVALRGDGWATGIPTVVSIRQGTLDRVPELPPMPEVWHHVWPHRRTLREHATLPRAAPSTRDFPGSCTPGQIRAWLGVAETRAGQVAAVLFPEISDGDAPRLEPLGAAEAALRLAAARIAQDDRGLLARGEPAREAALPAPPAFVCRLGAYPPGGAPALLAELRYRLEEARPVVGWDLSRLDGRMTVGPLPWSYEDLAGAALAASSAAVDLGTGGGERLAPLAPRAAGTLAAVESVRANVDVARARLAPLGVEVRERERGAPLPFPDGSLDLVLARHFGFRPDEVARVLRRGGRLVTQQVDPRSYDALRAAFGRPPARDLELVDGCERAGLVVDDLRHAEVERTFTDVAALVSYLVAMPWVVPDFSVAADLPQLRRLDDGAPLRYRARYVLVRAHRR